LKYTYFCIIFNYVWFFLLLRKGALKMKLINDALESLKTDTNLLSDAIENLKTDSRLPAIQEDYARNADQYEIKWEKFLSLSRKWIFERFPSNLPDEATVFDIGCGTGTFLNELYQKFPNYSYIGFDGSIDMLNKARGLDVPMNLGYGDLDKSDLSGQQYDVVLSLNVLHHLDEPQYHLEQIASLVPEGGTAFLCDFAIDTPFIKAAELYWRGFRPSHSKAFSSKELKDMIEASGLNIAEEAILKPDGFWNIQIYKLTA
jgi:2-polyprenyl-3-methyl-5-hydroxy-6-metoxy-1,4-benzoquinol methylase